jgi:alcohol dehydrogenase class IV
MSTAERPDNSVFTWAATPLKFGTGAVAEIGGDARSLGIRRVLLLTDAGVAATGVPERAAATLLAAGVECEIFGGVAVEPTDASIALAHDAARRLRPDGLVAVGGGSAIDTAKAVNLLLTQPGTLLDYVAQPIGGGRQPSRPLLPLIAVPTTSGTGSESTSICVIDLLDLRLKAGISHPRLRPALAVVDPEVTVTMPPQVTAASGMDVLTHALESYTALAYDARPAPDDPSSRPAFSGANPISDVWCERALAIVGRNLRQAVWHGDDSGARQQMAFAATVTGMGFGNAGTHIPHANAYPIAGAVRGYQADGYPPMPMVPHGYAVASTAPAAFRFTYDGHPQRHRHAADLISGSPVDPDEGADALPRVLRELMRDIGIPSGIRSFGYDESDIGMLVDGTMKQSRQLAVVPVPLGRESCARIYTESLSNWLSARSRPGRRRSAPPSRRRRRCSRGRGRAAGPRGPAGSGRSPSPRPAAR